MPEDPPDYAPDRWNSFVDVQASRGRLTDFEARLLKSGHMDPVAVAAVILVGELREVRNALAQLARAAPDPERL